VNHLLVTNDFPPKVGGIQTYLWELWRRLEPSTFTVVTTATGQGDAAFDAEQAEAGMKIVRLNQPIMLPTPALARRVRTTARDHDASLVVLDPAMPLGLLGPRLGLPYAVVLHGAEVTVPARLPALRAGLRHVLASADLVIAAGRYPAAEAVRALPGRQLPIVCVPPGIDTRQVRPLSPARAADHRRRLGVPSGGYLVSSVSRLVPRKGMDRLIQAAAALGPSFPDLRVKIAGDGRDRGRLSRLIRAAQAPVDLLGRVSETDKAFLLGASDLFAMTCRSRWGGLEQEGFGIVFLEAAAAGVAQVAGASGGSCEAVEDGVTGLVVEEPDDPGALAAALRRLLGDEKRRKAMGRAARRRAEQSFDYEVIAPRLGEALSQVGGRLRFEHAGGP
jgi:phosphatidyl-myo-inositol dimannoside synthase